MNKAERAKLRRALNDIMAPDGEGDNDRNYTRGIGLICELLGMRYPAWHDTQNLKTVRIEDIPVNGEFRFPGCNDA